MVCTKRSWIFWNNHISICTYLVVFIILKSHTFNMPSSPPEIINGWMLFQWITLISVSWAVTVMQGLTGPIRQSHTRIVWSTEQLANTYQQMKQLWHTYISKQSTNQNLRNILTKTFPHVVHQSVIVHIKILIESTESIGDFYDLLEENFQQNFILNRYGPVKGIKELGRDENKQEHYLTKEWCQKGKRRKLSYTYCILNECRVVFVCFISSIIL